MRLSSVSIASSPKSSRSPSRASAYASSTKSTPSSALRMTRSVLTAVSPTYWPTSPARSTSTRCPFRSKPIERYICASRRATVVLPAPGLPRKTRCCVVATSGRPASLRFACTRRNATSARTCSFTDSSPGSESSSSSSSSSGRAGSWRRSASRSSSSPICARSWSPSAFRESSGLGIPGRYPLPSGSMPPPMKPEELRRYAEMIVKGCIAFRRGDTLVIRSAIAHRELAAALAEAAYATGALGVDVEYDDPRIYSARILHASDKALGRRTQWQRERMRALGTEHVAIVQIMGESELDVTAALPPERVAEDSKRLGSGPEMARIRRESRLRGTICAWPTDDWAVRVFPRLDPEQGKRKLAQDLLAFCRVGPKDPPGHKGWTQHLATLRRRAANLTKLDLKELHVRDEGTDLRLRIAPYSMWRGGGEQDHWGRHIAMNVPTEECFISPDAAATEGTFRCSRPRSFGGRVIEGLSGEFRGGRLVRLRAKRQSDREWLSRYLAAIPNADRLGEIALVDSSSRIGRTGLIYYNGLLDENAAAHMAFGSGFAKTRTVPIGQKRYGVNRSKTHIDVMIGTDALDAEGISQAGKRIPLVAGGMWRI